MAGISAADFSLGKGQIQEHISAAGINADDFLLDKG